MGDAVGLDHARALEVERVTFEVREQADAAAEQNRDHVQMNLVEQVRSEVLLADVGRGDPDRPVTGDRAGVPQCALDPVGDGDSLGPGADVPVGRLVGEQEERSADGMMAAPAAERSRTCVCR